MVSGGGAGGGGGGGSAGKNGPGKSIGRHKFNQDPKVQKFIREKINNGSAIIKNFLPAIEKLMMVNGKNPTAIQSIGAQNQSAIQSQLSSWFGGGGGGGGGQPKEEKDDCEFLLMTPDDELTEEQLEKKRDCEILAALVDEEIRTGSVNNDVFVDVSNVGQSGISEFNNPQSGLSVTISAIANLTSNVAAETTYVSNNFTHVANETTIEIHSAAIANVSFLTFNANGHMVFANSVVVTQTFEVTGAVTCSNTIGVTNTATFSNTVDVTGAVLLSNTLGVTNTGTFSNTVDITGQLTCLSPVTLPTYTVAGVPSASPAGQIAYISDEAGGATIAFTDGTNWRRQTDLTIIA